MDIIEQLTRDEGCRQFPYVDTVGKTTIGVGRNLTDVGLSAEEIDYLLANDVKKVQGQLSAYDWYNKLDPVRQGAIQNLTFNIGINGVLHFPSAIHYLSVGDWGNAKAQLLNSLWATQVGQRAQRLAQQIETGVWV